MKRLPPVFVLYENPDWLPPLTAALERQGLEVRPWLVWHGVIDPHKPPELGVYLNRMSPSSHTRGHDESVGLMIELLDWLEGHGACVINGAKAFRLEISKLAQDLALRRMGVRTPKTLLAVGRDQIVRAAEELSCPFISKHNQGGKGLGIVLFDSKDALIRHLDSEAFEPGPRGQPIASGVHRAATRVHHTS